MMRLALWWYTLTAIFASSSRGRFVGRARTRDARPQSLIQPIAIHKPSLAEQEQAWLGRSCLTSKDLPGQLLPRRSERTIEFFDIDGKRVREADIVRRFRTPLNPDVDPDPKYLHPSGVRSHLYYPQNGRNDWRSWAADAKQRKIFVEGCSKAACATKFGFPAGGILGCWGWSARKHGLLILPEFNDYTLAGCDVYWVPDRDRKPKSVIDVLRASNALALLLKEREALVHVVWLPLLEGFDKVGLDDFLWHYSREGKDLKAGKAALEDLLRATPVWQDFEITEPGNARRWVAMYGSRFRHIASAKGGRWLAYRDGCWWDDTRLEYQETAKEMFEGMLEDTRKIGNSVLFAVLQQHVTARRIENVARLAKSDAAIATTSDLFDRQPLLVNCKNGVLEMPLDKASKFQFRDHTPDDLLTRQVSVAYRPDAKCPVFLAALDFWTKKDQDLQRTIQQLLGISLTGVTREQVFIILYGPGQTGKSTLIEIARAISNNYSKTISSEHFLVRRHGAPEERKLASLPGVRFASSSETEQSGVLDENYIKLLTGEDSATGRRLYEEQFDFLPEAKIWLRTNNRPDIRSTGNAIWRRVVALPFGQIIPEKIKDPLLKDKLRQELEGIFEWMVRGYLDYAENGLFRAPAVLEAIAEYRKEQDVMERFFEAECEIGAAYSITREALYLAFSHWCEREKVRVAPNLKKFKNEIVTRFNDRIKEKQVLVKGSKPKKQEWRWVGIDTKTHIWELETKPAKATQEKGEDQK
jgi:putative DNA primase/helicase